MASVAQIEANRLNARKSTGPRTVQGKARVSQNGIRHGFTARQDVIKGESQDQFDAHREEVLAELAPIGRMETALAERVASLMWRLKRAERFQNESIDTLMEKLNSGPLAKLTQRLEGRADGGEDGLTLGRVAVKDFSNARVIEKLLMYERRLEHSLYRTLAELQQLRLMRDVEAKHRTGDSDSKTGPKEERPCKAKPIPPESDHTQLLDTQTVTAYSSSTELEKANPIQSHSRPSAMAWMTKIVCTTQPFLVRFQRLLDWYFSGRGGTMAGAGVG